MKAREVVEGRRVPEEVFITQFINSQKVVSELKHIFEGQIDIMFIEKNINGKNDVPHLNVNDIDGLLCKKYNRASLEAIVKLDSYEGK